MTFNQDKRLLAAQVIAGNNTEGFDLTNDGVVNGSDIDAFLVEVERVKGDADLNGLVEFADFLVLSENFGLTGVLYSGGDFDVNDTVAFADFLVLSENYGQQAGEVAAVPEPAGMVLAWLLLASLSRRIGRER